VQTVVETPTYLSAAEKLFSEEERADIVLTLQLIRSVGSHEREWWISQIPRCARGKGKSGGARVVYIQRDNTVPVFLIAVFPKNEKENLAKGERNALKKRADTICENYRRRLGYEDTV
jgi:hypothetical protein